MKFSVHGSTVVVDPAVGIVAGFTGRDEEETRAHIDELAAAGVPVPSQVPTFYPIPPSLLVQDTDLAVVHGGTSGEAEIAIVVDGPHTWVTLASDHTDRLAEAHDIGLSKAVCPKVLAGEAWPYAQVRDRWDDLRLRSWLTVDGDRQIYQDGTAAALMPPEDLLGRIPFKRRPDTFVLLTGTLATFGGIRPGDRFDAELHDDARGHTISLGYTVQVLDLLTVP